MEIVLLPHHRKVDKRRLAHRRAVGLRRCENRDRVDVTPAC